MTKRARADSEMPKDVVLNLAKVCFASHEDPFRVKMALTEGDLPMRLWLEDKKSKLECNVKDFQDRKPKDANYEVPAKAVIEGLEGALSALASSNGKTDKYTVELKSSKHGHLELVAKFRFFPSLEAVYSFDLAPVHIEKIDILEAKLRDLEEVGQSPKKIIGLQARTIVGTPGGNFVHWELVSLNKSHQVMDLDGDTTVVLYTPGLYEIQVTGTRIWSGGYCLTIVVDDKQVASTPIQENSYCNSLSHLLVTTGEMTKFKVLCHGVGHPLSPGATMTVLYIGKFN
ncbi:hypothetical protein Ae201684P_000821 [Aphanomyces euteiches]|nr:hypothetical protein Ae201684P_000821 [Aphanomyces euteiches]